MGTRITFDIVGMSCAACAARVDKAARAVHGVADVNVNLLKNSMVVEFDEAYDEDRRQAAIESVNFAVTRAGYESHEHLSRGATQAPSTKALAASVQVKKRLIISLIFTVPLFYLGIACLFGWPLPVDASSAEGFVALAGIEFLLACPVLWVNRVFFTNGLRALGNGAPNMDTLVALGAGTSFLYSFGFFVGDLCAVIGGAGVVGGSSATGSGAQGLYFDSSAVILTLITVGKYLEARAKAKTTSSLDALLEKAPQTAVLVGKASDYAQADLSQVVWKNAPQKVIPAADIAVDDILLVYALCTIPADGVLIDGFASVDESVFTGEAIPVDKEKGDRLVAGTLVESGAVVMRATAVGADTAFAEIVRLVDEATSSKAPIQQVADKISAIFVPAVIGVALLTLVVWLCLGAGTEKALMYAVSVLLISCPCSLGLATPCAVMVGLGAGARRGILFKNAESLQQLCSVKSVLFDKTGTLTTGKPQVMAYQKNDACVLDDKEVAALVLALEYASQHALARALCAWAHEQGADEVSVRAEGCEVLPRGVVADVDGKSCCLGNADFLTSRGIATEAYAQSVAEWSDQGGVLLLLAVDDSIVASFALADEVRSTSQEAVGALRARNMDVTVLTGDSDGAAAHVCALAGVQYFQARLLPSEKDACVKDAMERGSVAFVGDGINDAPALAAATVGIAIGAGTEVAIQSADVVLVNSDPMDVVSAVQLSTRTMRIIKQNLFWALGYNTLCIPLAAGVFAWAGITLNPMIAALCMSMSSLCVVSNALRLRTWKPLDSAGDNRGLAVPCDSDQVCHNTENAETIDEDATNDELREIKEPKEEKELTMEKTLKVEGMMCQHCVHHVKVALEAIEGVTMVDVNLEKGTATVQCEGVADDALVAAVKAAGYEACMQ